MNGIDEPDLPDLLDPARTIIATFSTSDETGVNAVAKLTGLHRSSVYKWMLPKSRKGTGGLVPSRHLTCLIQEARKTGKPLPTEVLEEVA